MERSQSWPDLGSPTLKFRDMHFIDTVTDLNRRKFQDDRSFDVAMTCIQTFLMWDHLTWPGDLTLSDLGLKFSRCVRKRCLNRLFLRFLRQSWGCPITPPARRGLSSYSEGQVNVRSKSQISKFINVILSLRSTFVPCAPAWDRHTTLAYHSCMSPELTSDNRVLSFTTHYLGCKWWSVLAGRTMLGIVTRRTE